MNFDKMLTVFCLLAFLSAAGSESPLWWTWWMWTCGMCCPWSLMLFRKAFCQPFWTRAYCRRICKPAYTYAQTHSRTMHTCTLQVIHFLIWFAHAEPMQSILSPRFHKAEYHFGSHWLLWRNSMCFSDCSYERLIKKEDGPEYSRANFMRARTNEFRFFLLTTLRHPAEQLIKDTYPLRVVLTQQWFVLYKLELWPFWKSKHTKHLI